jgi:predicted nucleic acid-binding protein
MKVFLDTSVLISAVVKQHVSHERSFAVLERIHDRQDEGIISGHSLAEMYAALTKLPPPYRHAPRTGAVTHRVRCFEAF